MRVRVHGGARVPESERVRERETLRKSDAAPSVAGTVGVNIKCFYCLPSLYFFSAEFNRNNI